jgi:hypothetical protein
MRGSRERRAPYPMWCNTPSQRRLRRGWDVLDSDLVQKLTRLVSYLLFTVYEVPVRSAALKSDLQSKAALVSK